MEGDLAACLVGDARECQVDERHLVAGREGAGETFAGCNVLLHERMSEGAHAGRAPDPCQLVCRHEACGGDQVGDELGERIDRRRGTAEAPATGRGRRSGLGARGTQIRGRSMSMYPSFEVSARAPMA